MMFVFQMVLHHGREDQCFWNSRCLTAFGFLPDFARVFTNYGYIVLGISFVIIVKKHKKLTRAILGQYSARNVRIIMNITLILHYNVVLLVCVCEKNR